MLAVLGDPTRLVQAMGNVLGNAAKYTERGGQITLAAAESDTEVVIRVRDNGIGIPADLMPMIFNLVHAARSHLGSGAERARNRTRARAAARGNARRQRDRP